MKTPKYIGYGGGIKHDEFYSKEHKDSMKKIRASETRARNKALKNKQK